MASQRADLAMQELTKINSSTAKMGGDAIAREATLAKAQQQLKKYKETSHKAEEKVVGL